MEQLEIPSAAPVTTSPWRITSIGVACDAEQVNITLDWPGTPATVCTVCGRQGSLRRAESSIETWCRNDFLRYSTYLHVRVPDLVCGCGSFPLPRPWARSGSRFIQLYGAAASASADPAGQV
jgi:hypothetical protein